jgi:HEAT repeat protein
MRELCTEDENVAELLVWLSKWDTEYSKFVDPKVQILTALEDYKAPNVRERVEPFLQDVNEPSRYHAAAALVAQGDAAAVPALVALLLDEESVRVRTKIADGLAANAWEVPQEHWPAAARALPAPFVVDAKGRVVKS